MRESEVVSRLKDRVLVLETMICPDGHDYRETEMQGDTTAPWNSVTVTALCVRCHKIVEYKRYANGGV